MRLISAISKVECWLEEPTERGFSLFLL
jgi:hypothetical protein